MKKAIARRSYKGIEDDLIYMNKAHGYYHPVTNIVFVYDREKDNVIICDDLYDLDDTGMSRITLEKAELPEVKKCTISKQVLESVKTLIRESNVMKIRSFEDTEFVVMDGEANTFYFSADGKRKLIECDNLYMLYDGCDEASNAGKIMKLVADVEELLGKEINL